MIGVLLTSTCYYEGIDRKTFAGRVEELVTSIKSLDKHIRAPYELIIADNSPPDKIPTEKILELCPERTLFLRSTQNPGKSVGEAMLVRDGVYLSHARGHDWLLKLTGRYYLDGDWWLDDAIAELEKSKKPMYLHLVGLKMKEMPWAKDKHPLYSENFDNDKILIGVATQAFIVDPAYLAGSGALLSEFLYREFDWAHYEGLFWYAIKDLDYMHWPDFPVDGAIENRRSKFSVKQLVEGVDNPVFETASDLKEIPYIDIGSLIGSPNK